MKQRSILRLLSVGLCSATLAACGDDGSDVSASGGQTQGTNSTVTNTTPGTSSDTDGSGTGSTSDQPTTSGMGGTDTQATSDGTTDAMTSTGTTGSTGVDTTMGVTDSMPECGNGVMEGTEECDDGNQDAGDGCENDCTNTPVCGNGNVESGEVCDDGNTEDGDECSADCKTATPPAECGDGVVQAPEACDDGNQDAGDGCENDCSLTPPMCGNGKIEPGEQCDDGNQIDGGANDFCKNNCTQYIPPSCQAPANYVVCDNAANIVTDKADKTNMLKSIGICNDQPDNSVVVTDFMHSNPVNVSWQVAKGYGNYTYDHDNDPNTPNIRLYSPREGETFLIISTGEIAAPNGQGVVVEAANNQGTTNNGNPDGNGLPAPFKAQNGSNNGAGGTPFKSCDNGVPNGDKDCSDTLQAQWAMTNGTANDRLYFTFKTVVPPGTYGYSFDFAFCSAEWPTWVGSSFNDLFIVYQVDPTPDDPNANPPIDPYSGNVTFIPDPNNPMKGLPLTITALDPYFDGPGYTYNEPQLNGTGYETHACSDWFTAKGGVQPGANVTIGFFIADMSDQYLSTAALIDNFRWDCEGCVPSEVDDCGVQPM